MANDTETVEISCEVRYQTDEAVLIFDGIQEIWIPKSLIEDPEEFQDGEDIEITIPEWLAKREGLI